MKVHIMVDNGRQSQKAFKISGAEATSVGMAPQSYSFENFIIVTNRSCRFAWIDAIFFTSPILHLVQVL